MSGDVLKTLAAGNSLHARRFPGDSNARQPVHTVYGGAHLFKSNTPAKLGELALKSLSKFAPDAASFSAAVGMDERLSAAVYERMVEKLKREPVEDYRIDFEDGYGHRTDAEEDGHAVAAAKEAAKGLAEKTLPPFFGIRIKSLSNETAARSARTLGLFLEELVRGGPLPPLIVTLPKVLHPGQPAALHALLSAFELKHALPAGAIKCELMIESPQAILAFDGAVPLRALADALGGRCAGAHFGTYDYTAACGVVSAHQAMDHGACDFAKRVMQASFAGTGVNLSDGATITLPTGDDPAAVRRAWRLHYDNATRALVDGFYQGWDLHPAQLPARYAAVYAFFLAGLPPAAERLKRFVETAARATQAGGVFDDAASGQGLLNYFLRARACGAITEAEAAASGLTPAELASRSFLAILEGRKS